METKKFTILHSNDIHGDFQAEMSGEDAVSPINSLSAQSKPDSHAVSDGKR